MGHKFGSHRLQIMFGTMLLGILCSAAVAVAVAQQSGAAAGHRCTVTVKEWSRSWEDGTHPAKAADR